MSTIRYPGGNFVSGFRWEDSVGPREERPAPARPRLALDRDERGRAARVRVVARQGRQRAHAGGQPRHPRHARGARPAGVLEHRGRHRPVAAPHRERSHRCVRREDLVPRQRDGRPVAARPPLGGRLRQARLAHGEGACASSTRRSSSWCAARRARTCPRSASGSASVLSHTYEDVDYISCHAYYEEKDGDLGSFLASAVDMDHFIETVVATADHVKAVLGSEKTVNISFDEWNVWYLSRFQDVDKIEGLDNWPVAPRLLEDVYSVADAVVFGNLHDLAAQARRPRDERVARPARERHRADHDRAGRPGVAADHLLPVRDHLAARAGRGARAEASTRRPTRRRRTARSRSSTPSPRTTPRPGARPCSS